MLLSAFHVSTPTLVYKHWLNGALYYLYQQDKVSSKGYLTALEELAKSFVFGRFLAEGEGLDYYTMIYDKTPVNLPVSLPGDKLRYGGIQNNFVFNYLDYLLWLSRWQGRGQSNSSSSPFAVLSSISTRSIRFIVETSMDRQQGFTCVWKSVPDQSQQEFPTEQFPTVCQEGPFSTQHRAENDR